MRDQKRENQMEAVRPIDPQQQEAIIARDALIDIFANKLKDVLKTDGDFEGLIFALDAACDHFEDVWSDFSCDYESVKYMFWLMEPNKGRNENTTRVAKSIVQHHIEASLIATKHYEMIAHVGKIARAMASEF